MCAWSLAFSIGAGIAGFIPQLPGFPDTLLFLLPPILSLRFRSFVLPGAFCLGIWWLLAWAIAHDSHIIPSSLEQQDVWARGRIAGLPQQGDRSTRFILKTDAMCRRTSLEDCDFQVRPRNRIKLLLNDYSSAALLPGEQWLMKVRLKRPHGFANPGGFDYEAWLFRQGIDATGYVRTDSRNQKVGEASRLNLFTQIDRLRVRFRDSLLQLPLESPGFLGALTIGDRYRISDDEWSLLTRTGTNHLMVISGLHISLVAWLLYSLCVCLCRQVSRVCLQMPADRLGAGLALFGAVFYGGLAGFTLPVQRALVMAGCLMSGKLLVRNTSTVNNLSLALLLVIFFDPLAPHTAGFWLSFLAVALLFLSLFYWDDEQIQTLSRRMAGLVCSQLTLFTGLMPVMFLLFGQMSLLAPAVNLVAIPFIGMLVVPLCLLMVVFNLVSQELMASWISLPDFLLGRFTAVLSWLDRSLHFLIIGTGTLPITVICLLLAGCFLFLLRPGKWTALPLACLLGFSFSYKPRAVSVADFTMDVLDVGQGLAVIITTRNHVLVYDTGPAYSPRFNAGSGIIQPFLQQKNMNAPDVIIVSHGDNDHAGGLNSLHERFPGAMLLSGENLPGFPHPALPCLAGRRWVWDEVEFEFLSPPGRDSEGNNASCVLMISTGLHRVLIPGDIEQDRELGLVRQYRDDLRADILIVPHHGSRTSSTPPFIRTVSPAFVVVSAGYLNRFGHPDPRILARYRRSGISIYNTTDTGALHFRLSRQSGIQPPVSYRLSRPRLWAAERAED